MGTFTGLCNFALDLIERDALVDRSEPSKDGYTSLHYAAMNGHAEIAKALIDAGADVEVREMHTQYTPILLAAMNGHAEVVQALIGAGADVNVKMCGLVTPLIAAASAGNVKAVKALIDAGARSLPHRLLALAMAWSKGHFITVLVLMTRWSPVRPPARTRKTPHSNALLLPK